ncbi:MAG TPA: DUF1707 domain-containing protein [Actinokineospora sp.]|nr:DUF1707 domain-containing protein [Actinokineospora sp.]
MTEFPQSEMRIGDAEREDGLRALGVHMSAGRLTVDEYGDRSAKVTTATTRGELTALFVDLPDPRPHYGPPAVIRQTHSPMPAYARRPPPAVRRPSNLLVPIAAVVGAILFFRFGLFPLLFLPLIVMMVTGRRHHAGRGWR